jgi:hypothetical protein
MSKILALGLAISLIVRIGPALLLWLAPPLRRRLEDRISRIWALLDVGIGTLLAILVGLLIWRQEWLFAVLLGLISLPSWRALWAGLVVLARTPR